MARSRRGTRAFSRLHDPLNPCRPAFAGSSYTTNFPATENPISESGLWVNGGAVGVNWNNVRTTPGLAFGSAFMTTTDDCLAHLTTSFHANQYAEGVVFKAGGYSPPDSHEIELLLRFQITPGNARGYEITWPVSGNAQIVSWLGGPGSFDVLATLGIGSPAHGDVIRAEIVGGTITVFKNGVSVGSAADPDWTDGQPGIGFFPRVGATLASFGWSSYSAGEL